MHKKVIHVHVNFFCAIFAGPLVLPWLRGVLTLNKQKSYSKLEAKLV